jgi:hypothetical protein
MIAGVNVEIATHQTPPLTQYGSPRGLLFGWYVFRAFRAHYPLIIVALQPRLLASRIAGSANAGLANDPVAPELAGHLAAARV